jgi:hypothetical protein
VIGVWNDLVGVHPIYAGYSVFATPSRLVTFPPAERSRLLFSCARQRKYAGLIAPQNGVGLKDRSSVGHTL